MKQLSEEIFNYFSSLTAFNSVMNNRLFPLVANEGTLFPFSVYTIEQQEGVTKDAGYSFDVSLFAYFKPEKYTEAIDFNDAIVQELQSDECPFIYLNSSIEFIEENKSVVVLISFKK